MNLSSTLATLTAGHFTTLAELTEEGIETLLGVRINAGNPAPLSDSNGHPIIKEDGKQLALSYTHAAAFVAHIIRNTQFDKPPVTTDDVKHLPIPFWTPSDLVLITADNKVVLRTNGKQRPFATGRSPNAAAGFPNVGDTPQSCAARELKEEWGIDWKAVCAHSASVAIASGRQLQRSPIQTADGQVIDGFVITLAHWYCIKTKQTWDELQPRIKLNYEYAGLTVMDASDYARMARGAKVPARFYASAGYKANFAASSALANVRRRLADAKVKVPDKTRRYKLNKPRPIIFNQRDAYLTDDDRRYFPNQDEALVNITRTLRLRQMRVSLQHTAR